MTRRSGENGTFSWFSAMVLPVTVSASPWKRPTFRSSLITAGTPPARWNSSPRYSPAGCMLTRSGMSCAIPQSSTFSSTPMWRAMAVTCGGQLVETPAAAAAKIAFSNALRVRIFDGRRSSHTMSTIRLPVA